MRSFLRVLHQATETDTPDLTDEQIDVAIEALHAKIHTAQTFKKAALELQSPATWKVNDEEEQMLKRLLAEYEALRAP